MGQRKTKHINRLRLLRTSLLGLMVLAMSMFMFVMITGINPLAGWKADKGAAQPSGNRSWLNWGGSDAATGSGTRPAEWATPMEVPGVPNCFRVSGDLYRGAQPTAEGIRELKKLGIRTVISLREWPSDDDPIGDTGLGYERIGMKAYSAEDEEVARCLKVMCDKSRQPVFVHCRHGSDRTGTMVALYRIMVQDWDKEKAIAEMTEGGYGYHAIWANLPAYIRKLDIDAMKRRAGI